MPNILKCFYLKISRLFRSVWISLFPDSYACYFYEVAYGKKLDLKNPKDYNEKIQWLKVYSDTTQWADLTDKFKVRNYIDKCGLSHMLVDLYGVWENANKIDFDSLPEKFVLKTNHGSGKNLLVYDKSKLDETNTKILLNRWLNEKYGCMSFQPHYWSIERRIIAEELLENTDSQDVSSSLIDYKFFCFHGEPYILNVISDRTNQTIGINRKSADYCYRENLYDLDWNIVKDGYHNSFPKEQLSSIPKPKCFEEMKSVCEILSQPFPQVRVDLYEVNGKIYFGELTFTPGELEDFSPDLLKRMGDKIN